MIMICFYVGRADDIADRLRCHLREPERDPFLSRDKPDYYDFAIVENELLRKGAERYLYDLYRPRGNYTRPTSQPIRVNLD